MYYKSHERNLLAWVDRRRRRQSSTHSQMCHPVTCNVLKYKYQCWEKNWYRLPWPRGKPWNVLRGLVGEKDLVRETKFCFIPHINSPSLNLFWSRLFYLTGRRSMALITPSYISSRTTMFKDTIKRYGSLVLGCGGPKTASRTTDINIDCVLVWKDVCFYVLFQKLRGGEPLAPSPLAFPLNAPPPSSRDAHDKKPPTFQPLVSREMEFLW